jgi:6,7-dimethyl-8-ribityllumazine synthase
MGEYAAAGDLDASGMRIAIVAARFNDHVTKLLLDGALEVLGAHGVPAAAVPVSWVPGAFELPLTAQALASSGECDAVVCVGCVIRGETPHFDYVAGACASGLARVALDTGIPVAFGVLTTDDLGQALARAGGVVGNKGAEAATTAIEMVALLRTLRASEAG